MIVAESEKGKAVIQKLDKYLAERIGSRMFSRNDSCKRNVISIGQC